MSTGLPKVDPSVPVEGVLKLILVNFNQAGLGKFSGSGGQ